MPGQATATTNASLPAKNKLPPMPRLQPKHRKWHRGECRASRKTARRHALLREKYPQLAGVKWVGIPMSSCRMSLE